jgi:hypothetical protein
MSDDINQMQEDLLTTKLEEVKNMLGQAAELYVRSNNNSFLKTKKFQDLILDHFLSLDNALQNTDEWSKDEILEMAALFILMTQDEDIVDVLGEEPEELEDREEE